MCVEKEAPKIAILMNTAGSWSRSVVNGILSYAQEAGPWNIWIRPNSPRSFEQLPPEWNGDGVIARVHDESLARELEKKAIPTVNVDDTPVPNFSAPSVLTDDTVGGQMAADFFIERGFRNIAVMGNVKRTVCEKYANTFLAALTRYDIKGPIFDTDADDKTLKKWLTELPKPIGLLAIGANGAAKAVTLCQKAGISVPHDVAILSTLDDPIMCHSCFPPVSGMIAPTEEIGYNAALLLDQMLKDEDVPHTKTHLPPLGITERLSTDTMAVEDPRLIKVMEYLKQHAYEPITMTDILKIVPMSRRSLERKFSEVFKSTPIEEIRRLRMNKAKSLLAETDLPMQEIAEACGYASYNYLSHAFKIATGMAPTTYRRQFQ